ncbi:hypothetical protein KY330_01320 [Candidatus Woesearchaeota archaeon]|nr:hypothetical protein [Candidatus Woesearchaeota archaeon]
MKPKDHNFAVISYIKTREQVLEKQYFKELQEGLRKIQTMQCLDDITKHLEISRLEKECKAEGLTREQAIQEAENELKLNLETEKIHYKHLQQARNVAPHHQINDYDKALNIAERMINLYQTILTKIKEWKEITNLGSDSSKD